MAEKKLSAVEAVTKIKEICARLEPEVVWSIAESSFSGPAGEVTHYSFRLEIQMGDEELEDT